MQVLNFPSPYRPGESPYEIFKDRMAAITQIVQGIKGRILNKYNKGLLDTVIGQLDKSLDQDQSTELINVLNADPGEEIYPDEEKMNMMAGQFVDTFNVMGKLAQKESMMGGLSKPMLGGIGGGMGATAGTPTSEVMLPKTDKMQLLNAVMNMPDGQMDFKPILNYMKEHKPAMMGSLSSMEQWVLNQAMGQVSDPKQELSEGLDLAKKYKDYFAEPTAKRPGKYPYTEQEVKDYEIWKKSQEPPEAQIDFDKLNEFIEANNMKLSGVNVNPKTGNLSYSFNTKSTDKSWGEFLEEAYKYIEENPDMEITSTNPKTGSVTISKKGTEPEGGLKDLTSTDINTYNRMFYGDEDSFGAITPEEYAEATDNWERTKKNKPAPEHLEILERALQECLDVENKIISRGEKNKSTDEWFKIYEWIYPYYKDALKGQSPKYLPPEEIKKVGAIEGALTGGGVQRGDYGSALVGEGKEKDDKGYIVGETYRDEEGKLWKYLGNGKFEEVEEEKKKNPRKR